MSAFWLHPDGTVQEVDPTHISAVIAAPERFGETPETLAREYARARERMPHEGRAREVIMKRVIGRGFIRVREKRNGWTVQLQSLDPPARAHLRRWAEMVLPTAADRYADVNINVIAGAGWLRLPLNRMGEIKDE